MGLGECIYWCVVTWVLSRYLRLDMQALRMMNLVAGVVVCVFAVFLVARGAMMIIGS